MGELGKGWPKAAAAPMDRRRFAQLMAAAACAALLPALQGCSAGSLGRPRDRQVVDAGGRSVMVPSAIEKVFCTNPIGTVDVYGLDPGKLAGWNFRPAGENRKYIPDELYALPSLGVWMGAGAVPNAEEIAACRPDVLLCYWTADQTGCDMADEIERQTGLPVVLVDYDLRAAPEMFRMVGDLLGCEERAEELASFCQRKLEMAAAIAAAVPAEERKSIFLAQGADGLTTDPVGSMHVTDALELLGVGNVADMPGTEGQGMGMPSVNIEQIASWNPDAVLVAEFNMSDTESSDVYSALKEDPHWQVVPCMRAGEVYRIPQSPFSWFGRPPSAVRVLGCLWLAKVLYPDRAPEVDLRQETLDFYRVFYGYSGFDEETLARLLEPAGIDPASGQALGAA